MNRKRGDDSSQRHLLKKVEVHQATRESPVPSQPIRGVTPAMAAEALTQKATTAGTTEAEVFEKTISFCSFSADAAAATSSSSLS